MNKLLILGVMIGMLSACSSNKSIPKKEIGSQNIGLVNFQDKVLLSEVLDLAKKKEKLIYIDFGADWCMPCQIMKSDVYTQAEVGELFNRSFINYNVDVEKGEGPDLKFIYEINELPTLLILDEKGRVLKRHQGGISSSGLIRFGQSVL